MLHNAASPPKDASALCQNDLPNRAISFAALKKAVICLRMERDAQAKATLQQEQNTSISLLVLVRIDNVLWLSRIAETSYQRIA